MAIVAAGVTLAAFTGAAAATVSVGVADTASFLQVQVQPFANLGSLDAVGVLVPTHQRR